MENTSLQNATPFYQLVSIASRLFNWQNTSISCLSIKEASGGLHYTEQKY